VHLGRAARDARASGFPALGGDPGIHGSAMGVA
jgi:hypothetical protein